MNNPVKAAKRPHAISSVLISCFSLDLYLIKSGINLTTDSIVYDIKELLIFFHSDNGIMVI